jgi:hypothetical protein
VNYSVRLLIIAYLVPNPCLRQTTAETGDVDGDGGDVAQYSGDDCTRSGDSESDVLLGGPSFKSTEN